MPLFIKKAMRTAVTMEAAGCPLHYPRHFLRADFGRITTIENGITLIYNAILFEILVPCYL